MTWKELSLKERAKIYKEARAISPDLTYFDIGDIMDNLPKYSNGGVTQEPVEAVFGLPEVNIYPQNEFGDIARSQGITTARNWRTVKEGTTKGINDFYNDPRTQLVMAGLPLPSILSATDDAMKVVGPMIKNTTPVQYVSNKIDNAVDVVTPIIKNTKDFISKQTRNIQSKYYNNAPWTFKPNPNSYYRAIPKEAIDDAINTGVIRRKGTEFTNEEIRNMPIMDRIKMVGSRAGADQTYFMKSEPWSNKYSLRYGRPNMGTYGDYIIEVSDNVPFIPIKTKGKISSDVMNNLSKDFNPEIRGMAIPKANVLPEKTIPLDANVNMYAPDWFYGFKKIKH